MEDYEIVLESNPGHAIHCRATSVIAVLRHAAAVMPAGQILEVRSGDRCLYRGTLHGDQAPPYPTD